MPDLKSVARIIGHCVHAALWLAVMAVGVVKYESAALGRPLVIEGGTTSIDIPRGASLFQIADSLEARGWLRSPRFLVLYCRLFGIAHLMRAGEYELTHGDSIRHLLAKMLRGDVIQYQVTLVEGRTFAEFRAQIALASHIKQTLTDLSDAEVMTRLGKPGLHPEGRFYPDTYFYARQDADVDILGRAMKKMEEVLAQAWQARASDLPYASPEEALVMASIVEKETGVAQERRQIAGVFVRRLRMGMRLQTDPTVIYGMGDRYEGNLTRLHLQEPTPYNTYVIAGLPPTPIANPGRAAIEAALDPAPGDSLYFVARGDGTHQFSATLDEHNRAVQAFQHKRRSDYRSSPPP